MKIYYDYYASACFPSGEIKCVVFDNKLSAERQCQKYADSGAFSTKIRKEKTR